jgi:hypothetical protein
MSTNDETRSAAEARARAELVKMIFGFRFSQVAHTAVRLGIADHLADGEKTVARLAQETGTHPPTLHRLLRALAALDIVIETAAGSYRLGALGLPLRSGAENSVAALTLMAGDDMAWQAWGELTHSVRTGEPAFDHLAGMNNFAYMAGRPELAAAYHEAVRRDTAGLAPALAAHVDFSRFKKVVDVGGGAGALLAEILRREPGVRGVLFDTPAGLASAPRVLAEAGVAERCEIVAGDFMEEVPYGGDAYVLKYVLLDWDDDGARTILANCRRAMPEHATLIVVELMLPERPDSWTAVGDLDLLVTTGGRERTEAEFEALLRSAGLEPVSVRALPDEAHFKVIEAKEVRT